VANHKEVIFVASENGALPGAKVGGVADVVRDLPAALVAEGWAATVVIPSYGTLHTLPGAKKIDDIDVDFAGEKTSASLWEVPGELPDVRNLVIDHERFSRDGLGVVYFSDNAETPFAADASKFSFLCTCVASWINGRTKLPDVVHLHDWHAAFYCMLREFDLKFSRLRKIKTVFTVHNLSYQGIRPLAGHDSSLHSWFPNMVYDDQVLDPKYRDCVNPMATAIRLADRISTVSPTYATEICLPSRPELAFIGGEGLESDLQLASTSGRLVGILNGCFYDKPLVDIDWDQFLGLARKQVDAWAKKSPANAAHRLAKRRLEKLDARPTSVLTSVGRLVAQKATLLTTPLSANLTALAKLAEEAGDDCLIIILGSGETAFEDAILDAATSAPNVLFLNGYSDTLADPLYVLGDLFLMPSSFEPCGISQMLSMRAGQPCVVHGVGGLKDTVEDEFSGFVFAGDSLTNQVQAFISSVIRALRWQRSKQQSFSAIRRAAKASRFEWSTAAKNTIAKLYEVSDA
jgi:starch synthase